MAAHVRAPRPEQEGKVLVEARGGRWSPGGGVCRCPAHDDGTPSLSVRPGRRRLLFHCFAGCSAAEILRALQSTGLLTAGAGAAPGVPINAGRESGFSAAALAIWREGRPLRGTPAESYLAGRGLAPDSPQLRYCARTPFGRGALTRYRPALIAAVRGDSGLLGIHRTFLDVGPGTSSAVRKCALGRLGDGAVRLGCATTNLGLAEGIETALSASALFGTPCWATLGTERFGRVSIPANVEELILFLDYDAGGRRAEALARKAYGHALKIEARYPPLPGEDWNDLLRRQMPEDSESH